MEGLKVKALLQDQFQYYVKDLEALTNIDSGNGDPEGTDRAARFVAAKLQELGAKIEYRTNDRATHLIGMADSMKYEAVIFDLDGTLLDTLEDLADSMNAALQQLNFPTHPTEKYRYFVGDGMRQLARRVLPADAIDESMVDTTVKLMSAEYNKRWNVKTKPYSGLAELLDRLTAIGVKMAVLSNKPDEFTKIMVPALLPRWSFHPILGARNGAPIKPDPQSALEIAGIWGISPDKILYVGDTGTDMFTANAAGMKAVGAAWGFRTVEELLTTGAQSIVHHPMDIVPLLES